LPSFDPIPRAIVGGLLFWTPDDFLSGTTCRPHEQRVGARLLPFFFSMIAYGPVSYFCRALFTAPRSLDVDGRRAACLLFFPFLDLSPPASDVPSSSRLEGEPYFFKPVLPGQSRCGFSFVPDSIRLSGQLALEPPYRSLLEDAVDFFCFCSGVCLNSGPYFSPALFA